MSAKPILIVRVNNPDEKMYPIESLLQTFEKVKDDYYVFIIEQKGKDGDRRTHLEFEMYNSSDLPEIEVERLNKLNEEIKKSWQKKSKKKSSPKK